MRAAMDVRLQAVAFEDKAVLRSLLELFEYDLTEFEPREIGPHGLFGYRYLDHYWTEGGRHAFFLRVDGVLAGFALLRKLEPGPPPLHSLAEFFVMRGYRRRRVGTTAVTALFDRYPGRWQVPQMDGNLPSQAFWSRVIASYTGGRFERGFRTDGHAGPMHSFTSPGVDDIG